MAAPVSCAARLPTSRRTVLTLKPLEPERVAKGAGASKLLTRIQWLDIVGVEKKDSTVFYVLHVYLQKDDSRLSGAASTASEGLSKPPRAEPDYRIFHRFSEFNKLFKDILSAVQYSHPSYCHMCNDFRAMLVFSSARAVIAVRAVLATTGLRQKVLANFLRSVVTQYQNTRPLVPRRGACRASHEISVMLHEFLFGSQQADEDEDE